MIGERIGLIREALGITASELSRRTNGEISRGTLAKVECGAQADLKLSQAIAIASALQVPLDLLADITVSPRAIAIAAEIADLKERMMTA